jgi:hypothetical protein
VRRQVQEDVDVSHCLEQRKILQDKEPKLLLLDVLVQEQGNQKVNKRKKRV